METINVEVSLKKLKFDGKDFNDEENKEKTADYLTTVCTEPPVYIYFPYDGSKPPEFVIFIPEKNSIEFIIYLKTSDGYVLEIKDEMLNGTILADDKIGVDFLEKMIKKIEMDFLEKMAKKSSKANMDGYLKNVYSIVVEFVESFIAVHGHKRVDGLKIEQKMK